MRPRRDRKTDELDTIAIPAHALPEIVRGTLRGAPSERHAQELGLLLLLALRDGAEHWQAQGDEPAPEDDVSRKLDDLWERPAYGEDGWMDGGQS
jgi:hypothetical protein